MNLEKYPSENVAAITNFLFIENEMNELRKIDLVLVLCNDNIVGIASLINKLFINGVIADHSKIIISGATGSLNKGKEKEFIRVRDELVKTYNYKENLFVLEENATNIYENLLYIKEMIESFENYNNILIVGAAFALRRIKLTATRLSYPIEKIQYVGTVDENNRNIGKNSWWKSETAKKRVYEEIERIGKYLIKGDLDIF